MRQRRTPARAASRTAEEWLPLEVQGKPSLYVQVQKSNGAKGIHLSGGEEALAQSFAMQRRALERATEEQRSGRQHRTRTMSVWLVVVLVALALTAVLPFVLGS